MNRVALLGVLACCLAASDAGAARVTIDFDFSGSQISVLGGVITIPPGGAIQSASASVSLEGVAPGSLLVQAGPAQLRNLNVSGTVDQTLGSVVAITGNVIASQIGDANGTLTASLANAVLSGNLVLSLDILVGCSPGAICSGIGTFPLSLMGPQTITNLGTLPIFDVNDVGNAGILATLTLTIQGVTAQLELVGTEVGRSVVPEPNTAALVGLGVLGLSTYGGWRRTRR